MTDHYFTKQPASKLRVFERMEKIKDQEITFFTASSTFSPKKIDRGTKVLIEYASIQDHQKVLDLGCGYGIVGLILKKINPSIEITLTDINERAVETAKKNFAFHKLKADIFQSDGFEKIKENFDSIVLNPPQAAGLEICKRLIKESFLHLDPNGKLQVVARQNKGGKTISRFMEEVFKNVSITARKSGYCLYTSQKQPF
ncbi:class I SAM-dependent methyltransferase [Candidatus Woesearchaeota archaeon]|nr:class I SAM-dependent methyltransferase [Candidatus Woesearchaeota archaeon]